MIVSYFLRFYRGYTLQDVLNEYARSFFSLVNSMYSIQAEEHVDTITDITIAHAEPSTRNEFIEKLQKSAKGLHGIIQEVRNIKKVN